jgi:hypothetical protein
VHGARSYDNNFRLDGISMSDVQGSAQQGFSVFTEPCHFSEGQVSANVDYLARPNSKIAARLFVANDDETVTFPGNGLNPAGNIPGFPSPSDSGFTVFSLAHTYTFRNAWLNEARIGYTRVGSWKLDMWALAVHTWYASDL